MSIIRVKKEEKYFVAANAPFQDKNLSWEARGAMGYLLSKPDGWQCRNYDLVNQGPAGEHTIKRIMKELRKAGYVHRFKVSQGRGKIEWVTEIYESPDLNPNFTTGDFTTVVNTTGDTIEVEKSDDIVSTDSHKVLSTENIDLNANPQNQIPKQQKVDQMPEYTETERQMLNKLAPIFADQCYHKFTKPELKNYIRLGYRMAKNICPLNLSGASFKSLQDLARIALVVKSYSDEEESQDEILKKFSDWWYDNDWRGKKNQAPTPAQMGDTWGQFEAQQVVNVPAIDTNGGFYV